LVLSIAGAPAEAAPAHLAAASTRLAGAPSQVPNPTDWLLQHLFANPFKSSAKKTIANALQSAEVAFQTPDFSTQPRVREIWQSLLIVSDSLLLLLLVIGAIMVVAGDWTYLEAKELAPRALIAALGVNLSLFVLGQGIVISNELVKGFLQVDPNSLSITTDRLVQSGTVAPIVLSLLLVFVIGAWGANYVITKIAVTTNGPWAFNAFRYATAAALLAAWLCYQKGWRVLLPVRGEFGRTVLIGLLQISVTTSSTN